MAGERSLADEVNATERDLREVKEAHLGIRDVEEI